MNRDNSRGVAFIPARSGSKRILNKNICPLNGHPIIAYSIRAAIDSGVFDTIICATDSGQYADVARHYGAEVPFLRPKEISSDQSPDIEWLLWMLKMLKQSGDEFDVFSILRPTSPFRSPQMIQRAWDVFHQDPSADSLRAVEKCKQHPGKMWIIHGNRMLPLMPFYSNTTPWHSNQYAALPEVYAQNASLEIAWVTVPLERKTIAGESVIPFVSEGLEGFDINEPDDLLMAEWLLGTGKAVLPNVNNCPYSNE